MHALADRQKSDSSESLSDPLRRSLCHWIDLLADLVPRQIDISGKTSLHTVFYSDAYWDADPSAPSSLPQVLQCSSGLGACMYDAAGLLVEAACTMPATCLLKLNTRETQIIPCELVALIGGVCTFASLLADSRVILFVDNISVACMIAKGATSAVDLAQPVTDFHLFMSRVRCSWWMEWIPSESNPADVLSRLGPYRESVIPLEVPGWAV